MFSSNKFQQTNNLKPSPVSSPVSLVKRCHWSSMFQVASSNKRTAWNLPQSHPQWVWSRDVTDQACFKWRVQTNEQLETFPSLIPSESSREMSLINHVSGDKFKQTNSLNPFKSVIPSMAGSEMSPIRWQGTSSNQRTNRIYPISNEQVLTNEHCILQVLTNEHCILQVLTNEHCILQVLTNEHCILQVLTNEHCILQVLTNEHCILQVLTNEHCTLQVLTNERCIQRVLTNEHPSFYKF